MSQWDRDQTAMQAIHLLQHEPTQKWNVELIWLLPLCKEELVEDCPFPPSKYSQGSLAVVSNHINYIGTPKLEDKKIFFVPTWYAEFLLHQCIYNKLHF